MSIRAVHVSSMQKRKQEKKDDIVLLSNNEDELQILIDEVYEVFKEYGMKVSESKSKVVCMNGEVGKRVWKIGESVLEETDKYIYI